MLINYSIYGNISINDTAVVSGYIVKNITTGYTSPLQTSVLGYYSINLIDFPNQIFNEGDIVIIEFNTTYTGIAYTSTLYHIISTLITDVQIDSILISNWNYDSSILSTITDNSVNIKFLTTYYKYILFKLYVKYNGAYKELDDITLNKQEIDLTLLNTGEYRIVGYVVDDSRLLSYSFKDIVITTVVGTNFNKRYIEWE